ATIWASALEWLARVSATLEPYKTLVELLLTVVIGSATIYVAVKQYRLEEIHARRDLWDRRMGVYDAIYRFLDIVSQSGTAQPADLKDLYDATGDWRLELLFPSKVCHYVEEIRKRAHELWTTRALEGSLPAGERQVAQTTKRLELVTWCEEQRGERKERFAKYLALPAGTGQK